MQIPSALRRKLNTFAFSIFYLIYSLMLLILAILIAVKAFRGYNTIKELLNIAPPEGRYFIYNGKKVYLIRLSLRVYP